MTFRLDSYCGLYCGACFVMTAYKQNRSDCIPDKWISSLNDKELKCHGCKSEILFSNCQGCSIRSCAQLKNIEFCNQCSEYPCERFKRIEAFNLAHHNIAAQSLKTIKEIGIKKWLQQQEERWLCSNCGSSFSWYEQKCVECGKKLFNSIKEEKKLKATSESAGKN